MNCPYCGSEIADNSVVCACCGQELPTASETTQAASNESPVSEPLPQEPVDTIPPAVEPEAAGSNTGRSKFALPIVILCVLVAAIAVFSILLVRRAISQTLPTNLPADDVSSEAEDSDGINTPITPQYPVTTCLSPALMPEGCMETVVGQVGGVPLSNRVLSYYYWDELNYLINNFGAALFSYMDPYSDLSQQLADASDLNFTWQDYLLEGGIDSMLTARSLVQDAEANGFQLSQEVLDYMASSRAYLADSVAAEGYQSVDDYLCSIYGPGAEEDSFWDYWDASVISSEYANYLYNSFRFTEDEIRSYYDAGDYAASGLAQDDLRAIDVRHILIMPETGEDGSPNWDAALETAETLLAQWKENPSEENFAILAGEYSQDPGSANSGGLYTDVQPGQMVQSFNDWCFDSERETGDTGIVETNYGYHIMYFVRHAERPLWMDTVEADLRTEAFRNELERLKATLPCEIAYESVVLVTPDSLQPVE